MHHGLGFTLSVFGFFLIGTSLNVFKRAAGAVNSSLNGITGYSQYFKLNGPDQAFKSFAALCVLLWWAFNEKTVALLAQTLWPWGALPGWLLSVLIVDPATAGGFGLFGDVLLDLIMVYLKKKYPELNREIPPAAVVK